MSLNFVNTGIRQLGLVFLLLITGLLHLPFLEADPDPNTCFSRGPFTDEGLNTTQLRNFIHFGEWEMYRSDNLFYTPLFAAFLYLPLSLLGTELWIARISVLFLFLITLMVLFKKNHSWGFYFLILFAPSFYIFQYSHYSLPEIVAICFILTGIYFGSKLIEHPPGHKWKNLILCSLFIAAGYLAKLQYAYVILLMPLVFFLIALIKRNFRTEYLKISFLSILLQVIIFAIVFVVWIWPFSDVFTLIYDTQGGSRYSPLVNYPGLIRYTFLTFLWNSHTYLIFISFFSLMPLIGYLWFRGKLTALNIYVILALLVWLALEAHKLTHYYTPIRYFIAFFVVIGLFVSYSIPLIVKHYGKFWRLNYLLPLIFILSFSFVNIYDYKRLYKERTFQIVSLNHYLKETTSKETIVAGVWANGLTWKSKNYTFPVWKDYFNEEFYLHANPGVIITEFDQKEANQVFLSSGINLDKIADSLQQFEIGNWKISVYWLGPNGIYVSDETD